MDKKRIEKATEMLLSAIGEDPKREGLKNTPRRVADYYAEVLEGMDVDPMDILSVYYEKENHEEIVLVKDIPFYSICEHHLLPFFGKVSVAYVPKKDKLLGISKLVRVVDMFSKRLQLQERMSKQIVNTIMKAAQPHGAMVVIEAEHLCMTMRGVKKPGSKMITSAMRGIFLGDPRTRAEALSLLK